MLACSVFGGVGDQGELELTTPRFAVDHGHGEGIMGFVLDVDSHGDFLVGIRSITLGVWLDGGVWVKLVCIEQCQKEMKKCVHT